MIWTIIQLVISGIAMGFVYALIGIEYTLIYNASGVLNFSHDKMVSLGAYIYAGMFVLGLGWNSVVSAIASLLLMAVFGILVAYLIFIPLRKQKSMIFTIMATIMFGKVIMEGACLIWGGNAFTIPDFMSGTYRIGNAVISKSNLFLIIAAIVIVALLQFYLQKTKPGKAMRCVAQNRTAASIVGIERYNFFGYRIEGTIPYYYMVLIVAILVVWFAWRIVNSKWGREFKAVRDNIDAVESCGIDVAKVKIRAFTLAAMLGSFAGALYAHLIGYINPESFTVDLSTNFVIMLMVGGIGSVFGNVIGAVIITLLPELLRFLGKYYYFVYYTAVLLCALFLPKGIVSLAAPIREKWNRLRARRAGAPAMEKGGTADGDHIKN